MFFECSKLEDIWDRLAAMMKNVLGYSMDISYKDIIFGVSPDTFPVHRNVALMLIFMCKWQIWLRRNSFVFENDLKDVNKTWKIYKQNVYVHIDNVTRSQFKFRKRWKNDIDILEELIKVLK